MDRINGNCKEMWPWQGKEYYLNNDSNFDLSNCTSNGLVRREQQFFCMLNSEATPADITVPRDDKMAKELEQSTDISSQVKSRRMLQFDLEHSGLSLDNVDLSAFLRSKEREHLNDEDLSEMSEWVSSRTEETSLSCHEALDESSEGWVASCFNDDEMQYYPEDMNVCDASDVHVNIAEVRNSKPQNETTAAAIQPVCSRPNAKCKGKKAHIPRRIKLSSSVAYPFTFIKPCSLQGVVTLKDINQRLHTPPSKTKNQDEDLFLYPRSSFSGKPVVGKTKIHTEGGKGSITITRTIG